MLRERIAGYGQSNTSVNDFKAFYWTLMSNAAEAQNVEDARQLLHIVPDPIKNGFMHYEASKRTPLHFAVTENFQPLGEMLLQGDTGEGSGMTSALSQQRGSKVVAAG